MKGRSISSASSRATPTSSTTRARSRSSCSSSRSWARSGSRAATRASPASAAGEAGASLHLHHIVPGLILVLLAGLFLVVSDPFSFDEPERKLGRLVFFAVVTTNIAFAAIALLKGKRYSGTAAVLIPVVGWVAAVRLATPRSPWARWFYSSPKLTAAQSRAEVGLGARFERWLVTFVGGEPTLR